MANWKIRPKDPFFVGLDQFSRLKDICLLLSQCIGDLKAHEGHLENEKVIRGLYLKIKEFIETKKDTLKELEIIKKHLAEVKIILDSNGNSAEEALKELVTCCKKLGKLQFRKDCGLVEA